jgi:hypothetical protein
MLHRLTIILITGFWVAMTSLLVVRELYPEATRLNAVPVTYVGQTIFQHEQASDLRIFTEGNEKKEVGFFHIQPRNVPSTGKRVLEINGSANITLPGGLQHHLGWNAQFEMSHDFTPERLHVDLSTHEREQHMDLVMDFIGKRASFGAKFDGRILNETSFTLDEAGFTSLMTRAGVPEFLTKQLRASKSEMPKIEISAQSSSTVLSGQKLSTFLLALKAGEQGVFDAQVSQLGQVLSVRMPLLGWKFVPFSLTR